MYHEVRRLSAALTVLTLFQFRDVLGACPAPL